MDSCLIGLGYGLSDLYFFQKENQKKSIVDALGAYFTLFLGTFLFGRRTPPTTMPTGLFVQSQARLVVSSSDIYLYYYILV